MNDKKPIVLYATCILRYPASGGPFLRVENSIKALNKISDLYIYSRVSMNYIGGTTSYQFYQKYCKNFFFATFVDPNRKQKALYRFTVFIKKSLNFITRKIIKQNIFPIDTETTNDYAQLLNIADKIQADVIWLGYGNISYPLLKYIKQNSNYKVIVDTDSIWSKFILRKLPYTNNKEKYLQIEAKGKEKRAEEHWGTQLADITTAVSDVDAVYYRNLAKNQRQVHIFSNVIDTACYATPPDPLADFSKPCIYLAGSFESGSPMEDAAHWLITDILPLVKNTIPNIHLYIIGSGSDQVLSNIKDEQITITGRIPNVLPYLCHANVAVVPLRFESGTRFKILEAGACAIPVVSTTLGAEGIPIENGHNILLADNPEHFAKAIIQMISNRDSAMKIAQNLQNFVNRYYSINALCSQGQKILDSLLERNAHSI